MSLARKHFINKEGENGSRNGDILSHINIAFWVQTPLDERLKRIQEREEKRFGARVLPSGDMYTQQMEFRNVVKSRDSKELVESAKRFAGEDCVRGRFTERFGLGISG